MALRGRSLGQELHLLLICSMVIISHKKRHIKSFKGQYVGLERFRGRNSILTEMEYTIHKYVLTNVSKTKMFCCSPDKPNTGSIEGIFN